MANALSYIRNVGKSVKYMSIEVAKEMNPTIKGFNDTNSNIMKDMYLSVKTLKRKSKEMPAKIMESQYTEFGRTFLKNLKQDISTGQFYNRERINEYDEKATMSMLGDDGDGMDFDFGGMDDGLEQTEMTSNEMMDLVGEKSSTAVASAVAKSAEYIMQGTGEIAKAQYRQMNAIYAGLHTGMGTINKNVTALLQFSTETTTAHYENSKKFYESVNKADQEKITLLKEISENIKKISDADSKDSKGYSSKKKTYSDMTDSDGIVDLEIYFESVKKNIKNRVGEVTDMLDMMSDKDMLMTFASSPVSLIMQEIMPKLLPKVVKTSMETFNKTLGGMFGSALLKLKETANEKGGFWDLASDIFGVNNSMKTTLDPSKYEKGRVPFDGITRKAIVEVIPTYLSKIYSALSGNQQDRFDYETGKFVTMDQLQKQLKDVTKFSRDSAMFDVDDLVKSKMKKDGFKSDKERKAFERDWEALKDYMFKNQRVFNTRQKKSASSYGLKGGMASEVNLEILRQMLDGTPEMMMLANNIMQGRDSVTRQMKELESRGDSVFTALQNGSVEQKSDADKKSSPIAGINNGVINELKAIHKEISYIRLYGIRGRGGSNNKRNGLIPSFDSFDLDALSNVKPRSGDKDYDKNHAEYENIPDLTKEEIKSYAAERIDDKYDAYGRNTKSKSFSAQVREAQGLSAKAAVVVENIKNLAKRPGEFIASVYDKADERMYDFIYGPKEDKTGKKSFSGRLFNRLEQIFDKFSTFIDDTIITPLKAKINKQNIHDAASRFFSMFGINLDETVDKMKQFFFGKKKDGKISEKGLFTDFQQGLSKEFKSVGSWIKDAFAEAGDDLGLDGSKKKQSLELSKQLRDIKIKYAKLGGNTDDLTQAASGMRMVDKTGLAVISEGEMIIPPDMDPLNIAKRYRKERAVKNKLKSNGVDNIMMYAKGKIVQFDRNRKAKKAVNESSAQGHEMTEEEYNAEIDARKKAQTDEKKEEIRNNILNSLLKKYQKISGNKKDIDESRWKFSDAASDTLRGFGNSIHDVVEKEIKESGLFGDEKEVETLKKRGKNLFQQAKESLPSLTTGATLGAGLSLMTGFIGGPLIGAGIGAAVGLAKRSESFQNFLFGEQKDGEYQGGVFSKELSNNIHKYLPGMAKSATVGGIITALPLVPGGPVAGIVLGSAFGFAKNSETVQNALFGEGKLFENKEQFQNKMRSVLPKMGIGAAAGLLAGPFGMTTNILLGSALGFASDTDKFKDFMFGAVDPETNERTGGLFGSITRPAIDFFHDMFVEFKGFVKDKILEPIKTAFEPLANQFHLMMDSVTGFFKDWISEKVGQPIHRMMERLTKKVFGGIKSVLGFILKPAFWAAQMPIRAFSRLGDTARKHQVKTGGTGKTMSAAARNTYRRSKGAKMLIGGRDHFAQFDESLENMDYEQIEQFQDMLAGVESSRLTAKKAHQESFNKIRNVVWSKDFDLKKTAVGKEVLRLIKSGYYEDALKYIDRLGTDPSKGGLTEEQKDKLRGVINKEASKMKMADKARKSRPEVMNELYGQLGSLGMNMDRKLFDKITGSTHEVNKIRDMLNYEKSLRGGPIAEQLANPNKVISEEQKQRHNEIKDKLDEIIENLTKISDISSSLYTDDLKNQEERFKYVSSHGEEGEENPELAERTHVLPFIRRGVKKVAGAPIKGVKAGGKIVSMTTGAVKGAAGKVRNTNTMNKVFGDRNTDWKKKAAVVSEGEAIISDVDDAKEHAVGSLGGKNRREGANPLFDLFKNIEKGIKLIAASSVSKSSNDGIDIDTAAANKKGSVIDFVKKAKNKAKNASRYITQFVDGHPIKLFKDKNGDQEIDPSSAETKNSLKIIQDKENTQKGILASLTSLPSKIGSFFKGGDKEEKEESWFSKIVGGIKNLASIIPTGLKVAGGLTAGAVVASKAAPYLESFWNETIHPYLSASWNGEKDGFGKFIYFFNPANPDGLLEKFKTFMQEDFPTIAKTIAAYTGDAVNWALTNVLPGLVTSLITNFPTAMVSIGKGIIAGVDNLISGRKKNDGKLDGVKVYPVGGAYKTGNAAAPKWMRDSAKDIQLGSYDWDNMKFDSSGSTVGYDIDSNISKVRNMSETIEEAKKDGVTPNLKYEDTGKKTKSGAKTYTVGGATVVKKDPLNGKLPKAFNFIPEAYKSKAISEYEKVKYAVVNMSGYGVMTVGEVLNSDTVVLGVTGDGEEITGSHALEHYETSKMLGMEVKLSQDEIKANTAAVGSYGTTTGSKLAKGSLKGITRSLLGASTGVKGGSKVIEGGAKAVGALTRLIPGVGKYSQKGLNKLGEGSAKGMGKASKGLQKLGVKLGLNKGSIKENGSTLFEFLDDIAKGDLKYDEVADVVKELDIEKSALKHADDGATAASKLAGKTAKNVASETVETAGKEVAEKALKDGAGNALGEIASSQKKGILDKFIDLVKSGISKVLNSPVVQKYFKGAIKGMGKGVQKATANLDKLGVKLGTKVAELLAKHGGKMGAKAAAKIGAYAGSALVLLVADALLSFTLGVKNANNIVGTVEQPDAFTRFLCGLANCVNEVFLLGLVPLNLVVDIIIKLGEECLGMDFGELSEQREEAQRIVDEYNEEHGTDLTIEEYNNKDKLWTKVKKGASDLWEGAKELGGRVITKAKEFGKKAKESIMGKSLFTEEELAELDEYNKKNGTDISAEEYYNGGKIGYEIKKGIDNVVSGLKTIGNSMTSMVSNVMSKATSGENPASAIFTTEGDARTGNKLVDYTSTVINTIVKISLTPVAMLTYGVNKVANSIKTFASTLAEAGTLSDVDQKLVDQAKEGDINPFTKKYWTVNTSLTGVAKGFNTFISIFHKVMALPQALVGYLNPLSLAKKGAKWVLDKLGIDDSENGSGSGAKGAAITTGVAGAAAGRLLGTATDAVKSVTGGGSGQKAAEENRFRNAVRKSQDTERAINEKVSDSTFVSQLDPRYANKRFNIKGDTQAQTLGDTGCAPAAATMAINGTLGQRQESMASAAKSAIKYKLKNDGVNAAYFNEEFAKNGMSAQYITTSDSNERANQIKKHLSNHNRVVLLGQDPTNLSKKLSPYGPDKHYIVANGMSKDGKYIYINDPESNKANVKYPANKILSNSSLGIAAATAKGSNLPNLRDKILYTISGRGALPGSDVAEKCWNYIRSRGCSEAATAGMLGNFQQETGMNPAVDGGPAAGLYQMEKSTGHFAQYCAYAKSKGCDWTDLKCQLDWLFEGGKMEETFKTYTGKQPHYYPTGEWCWWPQKMTWDEFKKLDDVAKATEIFERVYERGSIPRMDKRIQYAKEYYQRFTGKFVKVDGTSSDGGSGEGENTQSNSGTWVDKVYGVFDKLATAYGLKSNESSDSSDGSSSGGVVGGSDKQKALVNQMKSIEGKLAYAQNNAQFPGPRSAEGGISSDCSETCQWAYKKVLNVDPGSWTGAMETDDDTYTVTTSFDESKMQPGDLILYNGHVEMYAGDGQMIGHGGPGKGPTTKKLSDQGRFRMIRRWKGFKDGGESSGSGSGLFVGRGTDPTKSSKNATNKFSYVENDKFSSRPYKKVENLISKGNVKTWLPPEYDQEKFEEKDIQISNIDSDGVMIDSNKIDTNKIKRASARGSNVDLLRNLGSMLGRTQVQKKDDGNSRELIILIKTIVQLLSSVVKNTEQLNNIAKLLGDYLSETGKSGSDSKTALIAKQNLINAMQGGNNSVNEQLMRLIESTEMIASE